MFKTKMLTQNESGYAAIVFAMLIVPLITAATLALDYSMAHSKQTNLRAAVESTSLMIARASVRDQSLSGAELTSRGKALIQSKTDLPVSFNTFVVDTSAVKVEIAAEIAFNTNFGKFLGRDEMIIASEATAEIDRVDIDFYLLLDNSPSMAVGATPGDITRLENEVRCAFACHTETASQNTYDYAKSNGIRMRIDAVKDAIRELTERMEDKEGVSQTFRMSAIIFSEDEAYSKPLQPITLLDKSNDYAAMRLAADNIEVLRVPSHSFPNRQTDYVQTMNYTKDLITSDIRAAGSTQKRRVMFLVTDGMNDSIVSGMCMGRGRSSRCMQPMDVDLCEAIKETGTEIAVLHTLYFPIVNNGFWRSNVRPQEDNINEALQACASEGLYYAVDFESGAVTRAMNTLFDRAVKKLQITQF